MSEERNNLPRGWAVAPVQELFDIVGGGTPSTAVPEYWQGEIPWITSADIDDRHKITPRRSISEKAIENSATNLVPVGSVIVVTRVGLGKVGIAETRLCFSQDSQALLFPSGLLNPTYVLFYMGTVVDVFKHISRGTTISGVTKKQLANLEFRLPPLSEQRRIVAEIEKQLTRLEAAVVALTRVQPNLKRYRAAVLKAAVEGHLVPTEAELARVEGRSYEPAEQLLQRILAERRARWEADQLAKVRVSGKESKDDKWRAGYEEAQTPETVSLLRLREGWCWTTLGQLYEIKYGLSEPLSKTFPDSPDDVPVVRMANITESGGLRVDELKYFPLPAKQRTTLLLRRGDLLFNWRNAPNLVGKTARFDVEGDYVNASFLLRMRPPSPELDGKFMWVYLNHLRIKGYFGIESNAAVNQSNFNASRTSQIVVPLPPFAEQQRIVAEVERRLSVIEELELEVETDLKRGDCLRQAILKHAFEGRLVPQDPNDEPASVLLEHIRAEREVRKQARGGTKRQAKPAKAVTAAEG